MDFFFIQMTDPQFGMFSRLSGMDESRILDYRQRMGWNIRPAPKTTGFAEEAALYQKAIAAANRLNPAFVVNCGDMVEDNEDPSQLNELRRITRQLKPRIPMYWAAGNWDVGNTPTSSRLSQYRERFGQDYYSFSYGGANFIVINSSVAFDATQAGQEWERQLTWLRSTLKAGQERGSSHTIVLSHHPLYLQHPDEEDSWAAIGRDKRKVLLDLFQAHRVSVVFSGHLHRCNQLEHNGLQMVTTGAVGYPLGDDPSGLRIVKVYQDRIEHQYYGLDNIPSAVE